MAPKHMKSRSTSLIFRKMQLKIKRASSQKTVGHCLIGLGIFYVTLAYILVIPQR